MSIYSIGDLHLSFAKPKPMNIFGDNWEKHEEKIKENWCNKVKEDDIVILPGDFSWAMNYEEVKPDFAFLNKLPGRKILIKGNHDYWWNTITSMNNFLKDNNFENIEFIMNTAILCENVIIAGTRGWTFGETDNSEKIIERELRRLESSIKYGIEKYGEDKEIICAVHYPPITKMMIEHGKNSPVLELLNKYNVKKCIYGHLHGNSHSEAIEGMVQGIELKLVSSDYLDFKLYKLYL